MDAAHSSNTHQELAVLQRINSLLLSATLDLGEVLRCITRELISSSLRPERLGHPPR